MNENLSNVRSSEDEKKKLNCLLLYMVVDFFLIFRCRHNRKKNKTFFYDIAETCMHPLFD